MKTKTTTQDIYFAAAMLSLGAKLDDTDKTDSRHMKFSLSIESPNYTFKSENLPLPDTSGSVTVSGVFSVDFDYYEKEWANASLMVNATKFKDALQRMKSVVHST